MVAGFGINPDLPLLQLRHPDRTVILHLTDLAAPAFGEVDFRYALADNPKIVQIRFHAVVRAASHRNLELVRERHVMIPGIIQIVELF